MPALAAPAPLSSDTELVEREPWFGLVKAGLSLLGGLGGRKKKRDLEDIDELALREAFDALYDRDVAFTQNGELVEREPWFGLVKAGLGLLGSLGGRKKKRDLSEAEELFMRELMEHFAVEMRAYDDALEFDARGFDEVEELDMRDFDALDFEAREIDSDMFERDFEWESMDARDYEDLEEMD